MRLLVVIVNYRSARLAIDCLASLEEELRAIPGARVAIVDNRSPDDSAEVIERAIEQRGWGAWASLVRADRNGGFAYGNNLAISRALVSGDRPDFVWLLNPDTVVRPGAAASLVEFLNSHPRVGIVGSRLENADGSAQVSAFRFHTVLGELENAARFGPLSRVLKRWIVASPAPAVGTRTDWVSGASFMVRREVFDAIGLLDERFFMYFEETDFCLRARRAGWETWYVPASRVVHLVSQSSGGETVSEHWQQSRSHFFRKHHGAIYAAIADLARWIGKSLDRLRHFIFGGRGSARAEIQPPPAARTEPRPPISASIGIVIIGRNEGDRLVRCLDSARASNAPIVYVDSGSTDDSIAAARSRGATVVELDLTSPFTAARARNAGFRKLIALAPETEFVQFIDGDCELHADWLAHAVHALSSTASLAAVAGRLREHHPEASIYNRLCDIEWNTPIGETSAVGGIATYRRSALESVNGFDGSIIAGEEPELCLRLRQASWKIARIDAEMALHDAAMTRFSQWWRRSIRGGHAYAQGAAMHGHLHERPWIRETRSIWLWGIGLPIVAFALAIPTRGWSLLALLLYPLLAMKIAMRERSRMPSSDAVLYGAACVVGKFPQAIGQLKFHTSRVRGRRSEIIEYKPVRST